MAGHEKYLKTTVFGMTGHSPDFVMLMIGSNSGIIGMTKEHLGLSVALNVPFFCVITKVDMCPPNVLEETIAKLSKLLKSPGCRKSPVFVKEAKDVAVVANHFVKDRLCPIFQISNVTGAGLVLLKTFLNLLPSYKPFTNDGPTEYQITDTYAVPGVGTVVSGTMISGQIKAGQTLYYGPDSAGEFHSVIIKSIQRKRVSVSVASAGHCVSFALKKVKRSSIRKGMVLVGKDALPAPLPSPHLSELVSANGSLKFPTSRFGYVSNCFEAEILILKHSTTIRRNYQSMLHCGTIRQTVQLTHTAVVPVTEPTEEKVSSTEPLALRTGDQSVVRFKFLKYPEYLQLGKRLIFREGQTRGVGKIVRVLPSIT